MSDKRRKFYTPQQLADLFEVHIDTIYRCLERGDVAGFKIGSKWRIPCASVIDMYRGPGDAREATRVWVFTVSGGCDA